MKYKAIITDFDGTLYYQAPVRVLMALWLVIYYLVHPLRLRELLVIKNYRRLQEQRFMSGSRNFYHLQLREAALKAHANINPEEIIKLWMINRPLKFIKLFGRRKLIEKLKSCQKAGAKIIIYSDNPVKEKICAINFTPDYAFWSCDEIIHCMKPDSQGLINIIHFLGLNKSEVLYIGDRYDKDGLCAQGAGIDYLDVKNF